MKKIFILLALISISGFAQNNINYKALIKDGSGNVVANQVITIQFSILQGVTQANVYQETHTPTTDANGIIILNIGTGTVNSGTYATIDWGSDDHYLNVQIDTSGGTTFTDMGTTQFMTVPYAIHSLTSSSSISKINDLSDAKSDDDGTNDGSSVFLGINAGLNDDGTDNGNVGIGFETLKANTTGVWNTANGYQSLYNNTIGFNNVATGNKSLYNNTEGEQNVANGNVTLFSNITGSRNLAVGNNALYKNIISNNNVALGFNAGYNALGNGNIFLGFGGGYNETGSNTLYIENSDADADNALIYGEFGTDNTTIGNILRINGELQLGNSLANRYAMPTADGIANQLIQTDGSGALTWVDASMLSTTKNTLNQAYNEGAAGAGRTITAIDGAVTIAGEDGFLVTGTFGSGGITPSGAGVKMFFNPRKAAFRAGLSNNEWNDASVGDYSIAMGRNTISPSLSETAIGSYNTIYTPVSTSLWNTADRLFVIGNGENNSRSNALTIYKSGLMNINDQYNMPLTDGATNQVMQTDGSGTLTWVDTSSFGVQKLNDLSDAKSDDDGSQDGSSVFLGINAGANDDATDNKNIGIGFEALQANTTGVANTASGYQSLFSNTTGNLNTAFGYQSLYLSTTATQNTAYGQRSLYNNLDGFLNLGIGSRALFSNQSSDRNIAIGGSSLYEHLSGDSNLAIGNSALQNNISGSRNTTLGHSSGINNILGNGNAFFGYNAGYNETGSNTLYIENSDADADNALIYGKFGTDNTTTGNILRINGELQLGNSLANRYAMPTADGTTNQVMQTDGSGNLSWVNPSALDDGDWVTVGTDIERQSGNVYIGNTANTNNNLYISASLIDWDTPSYYVNPGSLNIINEIQFDIGSATDPKIRFTETNSGFYSPGADITSYTANGTEAVRFEANGMVKIITVIDASGTAGSGVLEIGGGLRLDNNEIITNTNTTLYLQSDNEGDLRVDNSTLIVDASANRVGFKTLTPSTDVHLKQSDNLQAGGGGMTFESALDAINWKIYHSGSALSFAENGVRRAYISATTGAYVQPSDRRLKKNITQVKDNILSKLSKIEVYRYHYLDQDTSKEKTIGVMAQDIQPYFPELVSTDEGGNLGMNYAGLSVVAIKAIKEQQIIIDNQQKQIDELTVMVKQLLKAKD